MVPDPPFVSPLLFLRENPAAVLSALRQGWVDYLGLAGDQVTDEHVRFALQSGLLGECAAAFPDPRIAPEIPLLVLLTASVAGAFQGEYALSQAGCALHSPALLAELGLHVAWLAPGAGLSRRGTPEAAVFHGDVLRKLLLQVAAQDKSGRAATGGEPPDLVERDRGLRRFSAWREGGRAPGSGMGPNCSFRCPMIVTRPVRWPPRRGSNPSEALSWGFFPRCWTAVGCWSRSSGAASGRENSR